MIRWTKAFFASVFSFLFCFYWGQFAGFTGFSFAWILNFVLMAWYTYMDSIFKWEYENSYFDPRKFEKEGTVYKYCGVNFYRKLLVWTGWEKIRIKENKIKNNRSSLLHAELKSRGSEAGHSLIFLIVGLVTIGVANSFREAAWLLALNLLLNVYPILLQRYNRPRYRKILRKMP